MMSQSIYFVVLLILGAFLIASIVYKGKKEKEYVDDERWRKVVSKSNHVIMVYYYVVSLLVCLGSLYFSLLGDPSIKVEVGMVFNLGFYILLLSNPIEYFSLRYYDHKF